MNNGSSTRPESRWPVALTILAVLVMLAALPERLTFLPWWFSYIAAAVVLAPMVGVALTAAKRTWLRIERTVTLLFFVAAAVATFANLASLLTAMVHKPEEMGGVQLLASSVAVWVTNVLMFALLYWQIDRGGPEARVTDLGALPDWLFPQETAPADLPLKGWKPTFVDYLYLGYSTATAFSTTDAIPLTARAKLLMMLEGAFSLMTIVVVASRAINILGT